MASKDPNVSKEGTADRRKHLTWTVKLEIIRRLENDESQREVAASHNNGLSTVYDIKKWNGQLWLFVASYECKGPIKVTYWKTLNLHNWARFTAVCSKGKPMTVHIIVGKAISLYDEIKITGRCTFSEDWLKNLKNQQLKEISKWNNPLISCAVQV